jgi:hypothetical protein
MIVFRFDASARNLSASVGVRYRRAVDQEFYRKRQKHVRPLACWRVASDRPDAAPLVCGIVIEFNDPSQVLLCRSCKYGIATLNLNADRHADTSNLLDFGLSPASIELSAKE